MKKGLQMREVLQGATHNRKASIRKSQPADAQDGVLTFTFVSSNNDGERFDWSTGSTYIERLLPEGADHSKLNTFFKDHELRVDNAIGKITNVRVEGGELVGDVIFGTDEVSRSIYEKYRDGILTDVSVGYTINRYEVKERSEEPNLVVVTDYAIREVSAVAVGFDEGAKKRKQGDNNMEEVKTLKERIAELEATQNRTEEQEQMLTRLKGDLTKATERADELAQRAAELERQNEINSIALSRGVDAEFVKPFLEDGSKSVEDFLRALLDEETKRATVVRGGARPNEEDMIRDVKDALVVRFGGKVDGDVSANPFMRASLMDIGRAVTGYNGYDRTELSKRMMVTTDFPLLLIESGNRTLEQEFDAQQPTYRQFVTETDLPDFRQNTDITRGAAGGRLDKIAEGGELKEKALAEQGETWKLSSYGNKFVLTRQMLINDDLGAFRDMLSDLAFLSANTANGLTYDLLRRKGDFASYTMADGKPIFHADHGGNFLNRVFNADGMKQGRLVMRKQVGIDGKTPLNIAPRYLIVSPDLEEEALVLINSTAAIDDNKNNAVVNPNYRSVELIVDAELANPDEWYLLAPRRTIKVGYLAGTGRRPVLQMDNSSLTQTTFEGIFDFGVMAEDYRGMVKGK